MFEEFIQKRYIGAKRFSLDGGESLVPMIDAMLQDGAKLGLRKRNLTRRWRTTIYSLFLAKAFLAPEWRRENSRG